MNIGWEWGVPQRGTHVLAKRFATSWMRLELFLQRGIALNNVKKIPFSPPDSYTGIRPGTGKLPHSPEQE